MKVGNSIVMILPKPLCDNFGIEKGDAVNIVTTDKGFYIPLTPKRESKSKETDKWIRKTENA